MPLAGNKIVDHSDVVGASPVGAAPTTSSFSTWHLASRDSAKTDTKQYENRLRAVIWCVLYYRIDGIYILLLLLPVGGLFLSISETRLHPRPQSVDNLPANTTHNNYVFITLCLLGNWSILQTVVQKQTSLKHFLEGKRVELFISN